MSNGETPPDQPNDGRIPHELAPADSAPDRNLALDLVRVTEAAAMAAGRWVGRGGKNGADGVAVNAMRSLINTVGMRGVVVIGEGEKDNAPTLFNGENVGDGTGPECDVAVDPIDGTTLAAKSMANAVSVLAVAPRGSCTTRPPPSTWRSSSRGLRPPTSSTSGCRSRRTSPSSPRRSHCRHQTSPSACWTDHGTSSSSPTSGGRERGSSSSPTGDVAGAIMAARPGTGVDLLAGVGGTPEVATGITDGELMQGVHYRTHSATTDSLVMRSRSGTIRKISSEHRLEKLRAYAAVDYEK